MPSSDAESKCERDGKLRCVIDPCDLHFQSACQTLPEYEQLDRELEALKGGAAGSGTESTTQELKEKLARLQAEAEQLGIDPTDPSASFEAGGYRGGYRGGSYGYTPYRARGR